MEDDKEFDMTEEWVFDTRGPGPHDDTTITVDLSKTYGTTTSTLTIGDDFTVGDINIDSYTVDTIDISSITSSDFEINWNHIGNNITLEPTMWEDCMPDPQKLKKMCEHYPALEKVYENFKTVYSMVEQDWKGNHDDEDDIPF
jgi:hypothetical protein